MTPQQFEALEVVWRELDIERGHELHRVPPYGLARPPRTLAASAHPPTYLRARWELPGRSVQTPARARALVGETCRRWRISRQIVSDLQLIVSELATNAVMHASGARTTVAVLLTATHAWVVVVDQGPRRPAETWQAGAPDDEHGRGLVLVEEFAESAGVLRTGHGTAVWARIALPFPRPRSETGPVHAPAQDDTTSPHTPEDTTDAFRSHP